MDAIEHSTAGASLLVSGGLSAKSFRILGICAGPVENLDTTTGYGSIVISLFGGLAKRHQVTLRSVRPKGAVHYLNLLRSFVLQRSGWRRHAALNPGVFWLRSYLAHRVVRQLSDNIDVVIQWQGINAPFVGRPLKPYAIYTDYTTKLHDSYQYSTYRTTVYRNEKEQEAYYRLEGESYRRASRIFTYNELVRRSMIEDYGVDPERVFNVGVGVCMEPIDPEVEKRYDSRRVVFIGRDGAFLVKGVPNLLAGFKLVRQAIPDAQLVLVGLSPDRVPPQPGVVNLGFIRDRQRLRQVLKEAALYAMTPINDASPGAVREAMAMRLPVVASNLAGIPEMVVDGETGYLVPPEDPRRLAEAVIALLQDENKMQRMGGQGHARVLEYFTWDRVLSKIEYQLSAMVGEQVG